MKRMHVGKSILAVVMAAAVAVTALPVGNLTAHAAVGISDPVLENAQNVAKQIEAEGIVLLKNESAALPLTGDKKINVFGSGQLDPFYGGGGSGSVKDTYAVKFLDALKKEGIAYNETLAQTYADWYEAHKEDGSGEGEGGAAGQLVIDQVRAEMSGDDLTDAIMTQAKGYADAAVIMISRSGSESADLTPELLKLQPKEKSMVDKVCKTFSKVIVLFNICNVLEMGWLDEYESIKAAAIIWAPGEYGMESVAQMLTGTVNPSGRLADTIAKSVNDHPSTVNFGDFPYTKDGKEPDWGQVTGQDGKPTEGWTNGNGYYHVDYEEGIYIGYRYFETFGVDVQYPFGYGLSYTDFTWETGELNEQNGVLSLDVKVTNTGEKDGKDVVEVYYEAPYTAGGVEKSSCVLAGFAKTKLLKKGESETVTVSFDVNDMASYDTSKGKYVLDAGEYKIKAAKNAHDQGTVKKYNVAQKKEIAEDDATGADIKNLFADADDNDMTHLKRSDKENTMPKAPTTYSEKLLEGIDSLDKVRVTPEEGTEAPETGKEYDTPITLKDVSEDETKWDAFLDQLTVDEMIEMIANSGFRTGGVERLGIPVTQDNDGPASVKGAGAGQYTDTGIAYPVETVLACTWNVELAEQMGVAAGKEAADIGTNVWYAPACNMHRSPMGGRNFEYYSEDPLLSGKMAAAVTRGAQSEQLIVTVKHFALNDQEKNRDQNGVLTWADEQTMREIYLKPFEIAVKEGKAMGIMSSFNRIGTQWAGGSKALLTDLLRKEWGFNGFVVTDYYLNFGSSYMSPVLAVYAQNDAFLTGLWFIQKSFIPKAMQDAYAADPAGYGAAMRACVKNLCMMKMQTKAFTEEEQPPTELPDLQEVTHTTVTEGFDWGPAITKVVLNMGKEIDNKAVLDKDVFDVYVERRDPATGKVLQVFDFSTWQMVDSKGNREIKEVYVSDASGKKAQSGNYITIEMTVHPTNTLGSPFNYDMQKNVNTYITSAYTVTQKKAITAADGSTIAVKSPDTKFEKNNTLLCDDFDLTGTFDYKDPKFGDISLCYASYAPKEDNGKNPLVIWLHGAGEGGKDPSISLIGNKVVNLATDEIQEIFGGAYILAPQSDTMWMNDGSGEYTTSGTSKYTAALMELIRTYVRGNSDIDTSRIYIGGCSNGGYMTMNMITTYPDYFAAAYPICEAYKNEWLTDEKVDAIKDLPIWFTHSKNDGTVMISKGKQNSTTWQMEFEKDENGDFILNGDYSPKAHERLVAAGNKNAHLTLFEDVHDMTGNYLTADGKPYQYDGHWSWIYTLNNECSETIDGKEVTIMEWLAAQKKSAQSVDKTELNEAISEAEKFKEADYTKETWDALQSALESARETADAADATQSEVAEKTRALTEAIENLKTKAKDTAEKNVAADKEALQKPEIGVGDSLTLPTKGENGSVITWTSDNDAVKIDGGAASITKGDTEITVTLTATITYGDGEDKVTETVTFEIKVPAKGVSPVTVNKADLNSLIERVQGTAKGNYTDESWNAFQNALTNARNVNADPAATQAVVDSTKTALEAAVNGLTLKTDISKAAKVTVSASSCTYNGKKQQPKVVVKVGNAALVSGTDYTVAYKNNVQVGKASVTITGTGKYMGTVTKTFKIVPKATSIKGKVTAKSKAFLVKWAKGSKSAVTGYEIQYSTDKKFKKKATKTKTIKKAGTTKLTVKKLKAKKKYYVRVRTYKKVKNTKYVSAWSKVKTVTTKK
ncbi:glycoside hydrolase family 3 N-terminal domain-containing protein [Lachnospiraceae bacterium 45-W7]